MKPAANALFRRLIDWTFPRHSTRPPILSRAYIVLCIFLSALFLVLFGPAPLIAVILNKMFGGEQPVLTLGVIAGISLLALWLGYLKGSVRELGGLLVLRIVKFWLNQTTRLAELVIKWRILTVPLGWITVSAFIFLLILGVKLEIQRKSAAKEYADLSARARHFVENRAVAERSRVYADELRHTFCQLKRSTASKLIAEDPCTTDFLRMLLLSFTADIDCSRSLLSDGQPNVSERIEKLAEVTDTEATCAGNKIDNAYRRIWLARINLYLSQQGLILPRVIKAHQLLTSATMLLKDAGTASSSAENALGVVYSAYVLNYDAIVAQYTWPEINAPPIPKPPAGQVASFVSTLNAAIRHLDEALVLSERNAQPSDRGLGVRRHKNNIYDLNFQLLRMRESPHVAIRGRRDPLLGVLPTSYFTQLRQLRRNPVPWIKRNRQELLSELIGSALPEGYITAAQLGCLEMELQGSAAPAPRHKDDLSSLEAMRIAMFLGFNEPNFFLNQDEMGMCPLVSSPVEGPEYLHLIETYVKIPPEMVKSGCS